MPWLILLLASFFEVGWAVGLKTTDGFSRLWPSVFTITSMVLSMGLLSVAVRSLPIGTAYAVWTGIGAVGAVIFGIFLFGESASASRLLCLGLIIAGITGLQLGEQTAHAPVDATQPD